MMTTTVAVSEMPALVVRQLTGFFPISDDERLMIVNRSDEVLERVERCFAGIDNKYFHRGDEVLFSPFHSGQWLIYLYYLSHILSDAGEKLLADKVYYLNKIMHSVDIYHEVKLPDTFFLEHPVGTVLGRAAYSDGFMAYHGCTVGGNGGHYPTLGRNFRMMSGSKILGRCTVGDNVTLAANTYVKDTDLPSGVTVFGSSPNLILKVIEP